MPQAPVRSRSRLATATNRSGMFYLGGDGATSPFGGSDPNDIRFGAVGTSESYSAVGDAWTEHSLMSFPFCAEPGVWGFGADGAIVAGGLGAIDVGATELQQTMLKHVRRFWPPDEWFWEGDLGEARTAMASAVIADVGWGFGGSRPGVATTRDVFAIRPDATTWHAPRGILPVGLAGAIAGEIDGKAYITSGGTRNVLEWNPLAEAATTGVATLLEFDAFSAERFDRPAGVAVDGSLFVYGGRVAFISGLSRRTEKYTPATDEVAFVQSTLAPARRRSGAFRDLGGAYLIGGSQRTNHPPDDDPNGALISYMNRVERLNVHPGAEAWSSCAPLVGVAAPGRWGVFEVESSRRILGRGMNV